MIGFIISALKIIFLLGFLILIHEAGHFLVAKLCKVKVNEFAIGFGPVIWRKQGKETKYALRLVPLGGFISMEGEEERSDNERSFSNAPVWKRIAIVCAGPLVNILFALIVYFTLMTTTSPYLTNEVDSTIDGYPASQIGLQKEDKIIEAAGKKIETSGDIKDVLRNTNGENVNIKVQRENEILDFTINPKENNASYYIGVNFAKSEDNLINRFIFAGEQTKEFVFSMGDSLRYLFTGKVGIDQMVGPVGISELVSKTNGMYEFIYMLALISISLGVTNLLPVPALDGGKILLLIIEAIRRKPIKQELELQLQVLGFVLIIGLSIYVTFNDILRIF